MGSVFLIMFFVLNTSLLFYIYKGTIININSTQHRIHTWTVDATVLIDKTWQILYSSDFHFVSACSHPDDYPPLFPFLLILFCVISLKFFPSVFMGRCLMLWILQSLHTNMRQWWRIKTGMIGETNMVTYYISWVLIQMNYQMDSHNPSSNWTFD